MLARAIVPWLVPAVRARVIERLIVNFAIDPDVLARKLIVPWLRPRVVSGRAVASFCVLDLEAISAGLPVRLSGVNCAHRFGAVDARTDTPVVWLADRRTDSRLGRLATAFGPCRHSLVRATFDRRPDGSRHLVVETAAREPVFSAVLRPEPATSSRVFASAADFGRFMTTGKTSWSESVYPGILNRVDLDKPDNPFEPLRIERAEAPFLEEWCGVRLEPDSSFHTSGGVYTWRHVALAPA